MTIKLFIATGTNKITMWCTDCRPSLIDTFRAGVDLDDIVQREYDHKTLVHPQEQTKPDAPMRHPVQLKPTGYVRAGGVDYANSYVEPGHVIEITQSEGGES